MLFFFVRHFGQHNCLFFVDDSNLSYLPIGLRERRLDLFSAFFDKFFMLSAELESQANVYLKRLVDEYNSRGSFPLPYECLWKAILTLFGGYALSCEETFNFLQKHYVPICGYPWTEKELWEKVSQAPASYSFTGNRGYLLPQTQSSYEAVKESSYRGWKKRIESFLDNASGPTKKMILDGWFTVDFLLKKALGFPAREITRASQVKLGRVMSSLGWEKRRRVNGKGQARVYVLVNPSKYLEHEKL